jgi:hypothetical protein
MLLFMTLVIRKLFRSTKHQKSSRSTRANIDDNTFCVPSVTVLGKIFIGSEQTSASLHKQKASWESQLQGFGFVVSFCIRTNEEIDEKV